MRNTRSSSAGVSPHLAPHTLCVLVEQLLLALLVRAGHDQLVLKVDAGAADRGDGVLEASGQLRLPEAAIAGTSHSHALPRALDAVWADEVELAGGNLDEFGVGGVACGERAPGTTGRRWSLHTPHLTEHWTSATRCRIRRTRFEHEHVRGGRRSCGLFCRKRGFFSAEGIPAVFARGREKSKTKNKKNKSRPISRWMGGKQTGWWSGRSVT